MENTKTYKIELNENEITKLTIFILQYEDKVIKTSKTFKDLSEEKENKYFTDESRKTFKNNSEYYEEMYNIINNIRKKLDAMPF